MDRKDYWNKEYADYWKSVTEEAEKSEGVDSKIKKISGHDYKTTGKDFVYSLFDRLSIQKDEKLLDYGCGFGRFYPYFSEKINYYGIDISKAMIDECIRKYPERQDRFIVSEGEDLPFEDGTFDRLICYGVFDACYQESALAEMLRVVKQGGQILISGKNDDYYEDDEEAYIAEVNARKKGHPNYFTDVHKMLSELEGIAEVEFQAYELRRGDFTKKSYVSGIPDVFYEWVLIIRKLIDIKTDFDTFSDMYSKTWKRRNGK